MNSMSNKEAIRKRKKLKKIGSKLLKILIKINILSQKLNLNIKMGKKIQHTVLVQIENLRALRSKTVLFQSANQRL